MAAKMVKEGLLKEGLLDPYFEQLKMYLTGSHPLSPSVDRLILVFNENFYSEGS